jgi:uncharacterized protein (TIGR02001 family)
VVAPRRGWHAGAAIGLIGGLACASACAQLSGSVAFDTDYRVRGVSFSNSKPTLRAALNYDAAGGGYFGIAMARIESVYGDNYVQATPYAGHAWPIATQRSLELGVTHAHFAGDSSDDYAEVYAGLLAERWNVRVFYAPRYFGRRVRTLYAEFNVHTVLTPRARLFAHAGVLTPMGADTAAGSRVRADARVGAGLSLGVVDLQIAWSAGTRGGPEEAVYGGRRAAFVASASFAF